MSAFITIDSLIYCINSEANHTLKLGKGIGGDGNAYSTSYRPEKIWIPEPVTLNNIVYTVTEISSQSLRNSTNLVYLYIASTVEIIGRGSIDRCTKLETIEFGTNSRLTTIMIGGIWGTKIKKLILPASLKCIKEEVNQSALGSNKYLKHIYYCGDAKIPEESLKGIPHKVIVHVRSDYPDVESKTYKLDKSNGCIAPNKTRCTFMMIKYRQASHSICLSVLLLSI